MKTSKKLSAVLEFYIAATFCFRIIVADKFTSFYMEKKQIDCLGSFYGIYVVTYGGIVG